MSATEPAAKTSRYLLTDWNPNDESKWDSKLAWRTLWITTYSLILAFCVWFLPSAIAPKLTLLGFNLDKSQLYWLTALPGLAAGILRLIYMFLPPLIGTRKLVGITSLLCIIPMAGWFFAVQDNTTPYWVLLTLAQPTGIEQPVLWGVVNPFTVLEIHCGAQHAHILDRGQSARGVAGYGVVIQRRPNDHAHHTHQRG